MSTFSAYHEQIKYLALKGLMIAAEFVSRSPKQRCKIPILSHKHIVIPIFSLRNVTYGHLHVQPYTENDPYHGWKRTALDPTVTSSSI